MALAAFASVFMGNFMEGGLLLAMFNLAHIGKYLLLANRELYILLTCEMAGSGVNICRPAAEEYFTNRSKIDVKELKENHPEFALVLDSKIGKLPDFSDLTYHEVPVNDLEVGSYILVKAGEVRTC